MKILMISHFVPYPPRGGSLQRSFNLLREASKENEIHLVALSQRALIATRQKMTEAVKALERYCKYIKVFDIPTDRSKTRWLGLLLFNLASPFPYSVWRFRSREMADEIRRLASEINFDVIHLDTVDLAQYASLLPGIPKVLNHHNVESELLRRRGENQKNPLTKWYFLHQARKLRTYEKLSVPQVETNLAVSDCDKDTFRAFVDSARFEVVPNGTDIEYFVPRDGLRRNSLVFTGGMTLYPNRDAMVYFCRDVYPLIKRRVPNVTMDIIGRSPAPEVRRIAEGDISIRLHGYVDDIRDIVAEAAGYVVPIRVGGGTRLKILDAFACGKAVVSTSVGCEGIEVTDGENILIADKPAEFADRVAMVLSDDNLRQKLQRNARKLVEEKYSWEIIGKHLNSVYRSVAR